MLTTGTLTKIHPFSIGNVATTLKVWFYEIRGNRYDGEWCYFDTKEEREQRLRSKDVYAATGISEKHAWFKAFQDYPRKLVDKEDIALIVKDE